MTKPNILQIAAYYPPHLGGMENCVLNISNELSKLGYSVNVFTSNIGYKSIEEIQENVKVSYLKSFEFAHTPIIFSLFFRLLKLAKPAVLHVHISQAYIPEITYLVSRIRNVPYIAHIHLDVDPTGLFGFLLAPYKKIFLKQVLSNANRVICLSEPQSKLVIEKYGLNKKKVVTVPNGVSNMFFTNYIKKDHGTLKGIFVGRLAPQKNIPMLIEALALMKNKIEMTIVGEGEDLDKIVNLIQKHKLKNINMVGVKTQKELVKLYNENDVFILPSEKEGFSLAMLEAMASGLPIIGSDVIGMRELISNCGVLVWNPSPQAYADTLDMLTSDRSRLIEMSKNAVKNARLYTWEAVVKNFQAIYKEVLNENIN